LCTEPPPRGEYRQADPPDAVTCGIYLVGLVFLLVVAAWVLAKVMGVF
jgi:hypothetical protein